MSLIMALETYEGIVMTADRLSTLNHNNEEQGTIDCFPKSFNTRKLFVTKNGYGLSCCGDGKLTNEYLVEQFLLEEFCSKDFSDKQPLEIAQYLVSSIKSYNKKIPFIFCGFKKGKSFKFDISEQFDIKIVPDNLRVIRNGDILISNALFNTEYFYYGYSTYRLQDAVNLLVYTNQVTAKYQQFQEVLQTVSEECDVLVLLKNGKHLWLNKNELHI